ncbi:MAG TPA: AAA family ATPase, partial [Candidatus Sumerlaeota bacterium]|nr:AAA family ATPase [Candidatus Sumerlaeota bacterium]
MTPDSRFLYLSRKHREALANLLYGIQQRKGFITLTGEIGSGKTTLCRALLNELDMETTRVALILNSLLSEIELLQTINEDFGIPANSDSKRDLIRELNQFLIRENEAGHNVVLIIDEAQNLSVAVLEEIRMLSNLETETSKLIQIVLMGQPELQDILSMQELEQLNQRISVRYHISALDRQDVPYYIKHRLFVARAQVDIDFTPGAHKLIFEYSKGIPRKINVLCDRCLLAAYSRVTYQIDEAIVKSSIHEIQGELGGRGEARTQGKSPRPIKWLVIAVILPAASIFIAAGVFLGIRLAGPKYVPEIPAEPSGGPLDSRPVYLAHDVPVPYGESLQAGNPGSNNPTPSPTPTPKPTATPVPPKRYYYNWQYDESGICRVDNAAYALPASMITWLRL